MRKINLAIFKTFFNPKKNLRIIYSILMIIAVYYSVMTGIYLIFLLPLLVMWVTGTGGVEFFNVSSSKEIQRTDISYFTTGDILDSIKLLFIIAILTILVVILRGIEKKLP